MQITGVSGNIVKSVWLAALGSGILILASLPVVSARGPKNSSTTPPPGEIRLEGTVQTTTATRRLILSVSNVTMSNGEWAHLTPPRTKQIILQETTAPHLRGNPAMHIKLDDLANGMKAIVVAADTGVGKDTTARDISVWTGFRHGAYQFQKPMD